MGVFIIHKRNHNGTEEKSEGRLLSKTYAPLVNFPRVYEYVRLAQCFISSGILWGMFCLSCPLCFFLWQLAWHLSETEKMLKIRNLNDSLLTRLEEQGQRSSCVRRPLTFLVSLVLPVAQTRTEQLQGQRQRERQWGVQGLPQEQLPGEAQRRKYERIRQKHQPMRSVGQVSASITPCLHTSLHILLPHVTLS